MKTKEPARKLSNRMGTQLTLQNPHTERAVSARRSSPSAKIYLFV